MELNPKQYKAVTSKSDECFYVAGVGSGKSFVLGVFAYREACLKGSLGLITAPVSDTLNNSTLPALKDVWYQLGLTEGVHYIIGSMPPPSWGLRNYTNRNSKILTWRWGSYTILDGSDNYNKHRGLELDYVCADELRDVKDGAWEMYRGRMRGKAKKKIKQPYKMLAVTTPPDNPTKIDKLVNANVEVVYGSSFDNYQNLPENYLENLKDSYDEITYRREVLGELIYNGGSTTYYSFSDANIVNQKFVPSADIVMFWDFNASAKKPMSTGFIQEINGVDYVTKYFSQKNTNTTEQCENILNFLQQHGFNGSIEITGDYSGHRKESNATRSDYSIIEHFFGGYPNYRIKTRPTLSVRDRVASLNAQFCSMASERSLFIDNECTALIDDLRQTRWKDDGIHLDDSNDERTHATDALSYYAYNYKPIDRKKIIYS
jgi:hypothetical protein